MNTPPDFAPAHATPAALDPRAHVFAYLDGRLVTRGSDEAPELPTLADLAAFAAPALHYLGELGGHPCVAAALTADTVLPAGWKARGLRALFFRMPDALVALAGRAFQVIEWDATHRFCGRCGTATVVRAHERAKECPACGLIAYPRVSPAMMALVIRDREILLARAPRFPGAMYSALAGFVEPGESIEDCVRREVREEVGIEVDGIEYFASQSWPFPHSLMIAFTAHYAGGELRPDPAEIAEARWFALDALPDLPSSMSIARKLIDATVARLRARG
jgi:NAD+ diphosphatase